MDPDRDIDDKQIGKRSFTILSNGIQQTIMAKTQLSRNNCFIDGMRKLMSVRFKEFKPVVKKIRLLISKTIKRGHIQILPALTRNQEKQIKAHLP